MISGLLEDLSQIKDPGSASEEEEVAKSAAASAYAGELRYHKGHYRVLTTICRLAGMDTVSGYPSVPLRIG